VEWIPESQAQIGREECREDPEFLLEIPLVS
jgi:hypothetical protein